MKKPEESRIYVAVAETVQVSAGRGMRSIVQPPGRQIAQACHVVSKLRIDQKIWLESDATGTPLTQPITTIILRARDSEELLHVYNLLLRKKLYPAVFYDTNPEVYGPNSVRTSVAVLATKTQIKFIMDYLPLWGAE